MKHIPVIEIGGVNFPSTPIPANAIAVQCNGTEYVVYEPGDTLPETQSENVAE